MKTRHLKTLRGVVLVAAAVGMARHAINCG